MWNPSLSILSILSLYFEYIRRAVVSIFVTTICRFSLAFVQIQKDVTCEEVSTTRTKADDDLDCLVEIDLGNGTVTTIALNCISVEHNRPEFSACTQLIFKTAPNEESIAFFESEICCKLNNLKHLDLRGSHLQISGIQIFTGFLSKLESLTHLCLLDNRLGEEGARLLACALCHLTQLVHLDLGWNEIGAEGVVWLARPLSKLRRLERLALCGNGLRSNGMCRLAAALAPLARLQHLDLG